MTYGKAANGKKQTKKYACKMIASTSPYARSRSIKPAELFDPDRWYSMAREEVKGGESDLMLLQTLEYCSIYLAVEKCEEKPMFIKQRRPTVFRAGSHPGCCGLHGDCNEDGVPAQKTVRLQPWVLGDTNYTLCDSCYKHMRETGDLIAMAIEYPDPVASTLMTWAVKSMAARHLKAFKQSLMSIQK